MTNKQLTINGLLACGYKQDQDARTSKYLVFFIDDGRPGDARFFVGKSGALRFSSQGKATDSVSLTDGRCHAAYREVGNPAIHWESVEQARKAHAAILQGQRQQAQ